MYIIPNIEEKNDKTKITRTVLHNPSGFVQLKPSIFVVDQYPLSVLYGYEILLFDLFLFRQQDFQLLEVKNNTDASILTSTTSLQSLDTNRYCRKLNRLYSLLTPDTTEIEITFTYFRELNGRETDIGYFVDLGCILEIVNLTGHIADFSVDSRLLVLASTIETKTKYPIPAALTFKRTVALTNMVGFKVRNIPSGNIRQSNFVLYDNNLYARSRSVIPQPNTFTARSSGGLIWI